MTWLLFIRESWWGPDKAETELLRSRRWSPLMGHGSLVGVDNFGIRMHVCWIDRFILLFNDVQAHYNFLLLC